MGVAVDLLRRLEAPIQAGDRSFLMALPGWGGSPSLPWHRFFSALGEPKRMTKELRVELRRETEDSAEPQPARRGLLAGLLDELP